jgi:hypothetical protein
MGIFDHRKTWRFETKAAPSECLNAFRSALTGRSLANAFRVVGRWDVAPRGTSAAVASYKGRGGWVRGVTPVSKSATHEQGAAQGSELTFKIEGAAGDGHPTVCSMWLSRSTTVHVAIFPTTADARFIRGSMHLVARQLQRVDPGVKIGKA